MSRLAREARRHIHLSVRDRAQLKATRDLLVVKDITPPSISDLARRTVMTNSQFCSAFRELFGDTVAEPIRKRRLELAHNLPQRSGLKVRPVAARPGYAHHSTFIAAFRARFGAALIEMRCARRRRRSNGQN